MEESSGHSPKWAHEGFDAAKIAAGTAQEDIQKHPILGDCYRVVLMSKSDAGSEGTTRGDNMSSESKLKGMLAGLGKLHGASFSSAQAVKAEGDDSSSSPSDSTDSSSLSASKSKK